MPSIDVTTPLTAGANAASTALGGFARGQLAGTELLARLKAAEEERGYRERHQAIQLEQLAQSASEAQGIAAYRNRALGMQEREIGETGAGQAAGLEHARGMQGSGGGDLEARIAQQRSSAFAFAQGLSPTARKAFLGVVGPALDDDERNERTTAAKQMAVNAWQRALEGGALIQGPVGSDPSKAPGAQDIAALAQERIAAIESGAISPAQALDDLESLRGKVAKQAAEQQDMQAGLAWAQQQITETLAGGGDVSTMHHELAKWATSDKRDVKSLQRSLLEARYQLKPKEVKIGSIEIPANINPKNPAWMMIAGPQADKEATDILKDDPWVRRMIDSGEIDKADPKTGKSGIDRYLDYRKEVRRNVLRGYAGKYGTSEADLRMMGLGEDPRLAAADIENRITQTLKSSGFDPDMSFDDVSEPLRSILKQRATSKFMQDRVPTGPGGPFQQPKSAPVNTDPALDGIYDERDIDAAYPDGG